MSGSNQVSSADGLSSVSSNKGSQLGDSIHDIDHDMADDIVYDINHDTGNTALENIQFEIIYAPTPSPENESTSSHSSMRSRPNATTLSSPKVAGKYNHDDALSGTPPGHRGKQMESTATVLANMGEISDPDLVSITEHTETHRTSSGPNTYTQEGYIAAAIYYTFFLAIAIIFIWLSNDRAKTFEDVIINEDYLYKLVCLANGTVLASMILLSCFLYRYREEPEIKSRNHHFILHYCISALLVPSIHIAFSAIRFGQTSLVYSTDRHSAYQWYTLITQILLTASHCLLGTVLVCRVLFMYMVMHRRILDPSYWKWVCVYLLAWTPCALVIGFCHFRANECPVAVVLSANIAYNGLLLFSFAYFGWQIRRTHRLFVDLHTNLRLFVLYFTVYFVYFLWAVLCNQDTCFVAVVDVVTYLFPCVVVIMAVDEFGLIVPRVAARRWLDMEILTKYELEGAYYRDLSALYDLQELLADPQSYDLLLTFARGHACEENITFIHDVLECRRVEGLGDRDQARQIWFEVVEAYIRPGSARELNLRETTRQEILLNVDNYRQWEQNLLDGNTTPNESSLKRFFRSDRLSRTLSYSTTETSINTNQKPTPFRESISIPDQMNTSMASIPENTSAHTPNPRPKRPLNHGSGLSMSTSLGNRSSSDRLDSDIPSSRSVFSLFHPSSPTTARSLAPSMTSGPWQGVHRASVKAGHEIIQVVRVSILPLFFESETFTDFKHDLEAKNAEVRALSEAGLLGESMHTSRHASLSDSPIQL